MRLKQFSLCAQLPFDHDEAAQEPGTDGAAQKVLFLQKMGGIHPDLVQPQHSRSVTTVGVSRSLLH